MKDYYATLGVSSEASPAQIRDAYRKLAFRWHPDRNSAERDEAHRRFVDLGEAYAILNDPQRRMQYDLQRPGASGSPPSRRSTSSREGAPWAWHDFSDIPEPDPDPDPEPSERAEELRRAAAAAQARHLYRRRLRDLARELAKADRAGHRADVIIAVGILGTGVTALGLTFSALIGVSVREFRVNPWYIAAAWLLTMTLAAWFSSARQRRVERYTPYAEEVLKRTGHGPEASSPPAD